MRYFLAVLLLGATLRANAQQPAIEASQRVRLSYDCRTRTLSAGQVRSECQRKSGTVIVLRGDTLILSAGSATKTHRLSAVTRIEVSRGRRSHGLTGAVIGAPVGAVAGLAILTLANGAWVCGDYEIGALCGAVAGGGVIGGALLGALVGGAVKTDRWEDVSFNSVRVTIVPQPTRFGLSAAFYF